MAKKEETRKVKPKKAAPEFPPKKIDPNRKFTESYNIPTGK